MIPPRRAALTILLGLLALGCSSRPDVGADAVLRPSFETAGGTYAAGTAFLIEDDSRGTLMITAQHLFGPPGGLPAVIPAAELPDRILSAQAYDAPFEALVIQGGRAVYLPDARPAAGLDATADYAAFMVSDDGATPRLTLAGTTPQAGDTVWLLARAASGAPASRHLHRGTVIEADPSGILFKYKNPTIGLRATSGAAVVNDAGEVIGVNAVVSRRANGIHGIAAPIDGLLRALGEV